MIDIDRLKTEQLDMLCSKIAELDGSTKDVALTMHAHPTLSEAFKEAALGAFGKAVHA